jgi:hypothetical protein
VAPLSIKLRQLAAVRPPDGADVFERAILQPKALLRVVGQRPIVEREHADVLKTKRVLLDDPKQPRNIATRNRSVVISECLMSCPRTASPNLSYSETIV